MEQRKKTERVRVFDKFSADASENVRLIILLYFEAWRAEASKNDGKLYTLERFGLTITNIRNLINGMKIRRINPPLDLA